MDDFAASYSFMNDTIVVMKSWNAFVNTQLSGFVFGVL